MRAFAFVCCLAGLLSATPILAQKPPKAPPTLLGRWQTRQISFSVTQAVPDSVRDQLDNPEVADLNEAIFTGEAHLDVEFRADSTYLFTIERDGQMLRTETGTFSLHRNLLLAAAPASPDGSSFHDQLVYKLTRHTLILLFPVGPELPGVGQAIEYTRMGPYPAEK